MTYTTAGGNFHNSKRGASAAMRVGARQIAMCEVNRIQPFLDRNRSDYRVTRVVHPGTDKRRKALWDNAVLTRAHVPSIGTLALQVSDRAEPYRIALPRTVVCDLTYDPDLGRMGRIAIHPNYIGKAADQPNNLRVKETDEHNRVLKRLCQLALTRVDVLIVSGDVNIEEHKNTPGWLSTHEALESVGLQSRDYSPIDHVFWTRNVQPKNFQIIPKQYFHTDHPGFKSEFVKTKRR